MDWHLKHGHRFRPVDARTNRDFAFSIPDSRIPKARRAACSKLGASTPGRPRCQNGAAKRRLSPSLASARPMQPAPRVRCSKTGAPLPEARAPGLARTPLRGLSQLPNPSTPYGITRLADLPPSSRSNGFPLSSSCPVGAKGTGVTFDDFISDVIDNPCCETPGSKRVTAST